MLNPEIDSFLDEELLVKLCVECPLKTGKDIKPRRHYTQQQHPTDPAPYY